MSKNSKKKKEQKIVIFSEEDINKKTYGIKKEAVFIKNSPYYKNDELVTCMILKEKLLPYKCSIPGCPVNHQWNDKPLHLLLNRKNKKQSDLTITNLKFQCPNCFLQSYGLTVWQKQIKTQILYCKICKYDITNLSEYNKMKQMCKVCDQKISSHKKSDAVSLSVLEHSWDHRKLDAGNLNKDYSKLTSQYQTILNKDELSQIVGSSTNQSQFRINFQNQNQTYTKNNNSSKRNINNKKNSNRDSDSDSESDSDSDNNSNSNRNDNDNNSNQQIHRLSNLESSIASSFQNNNSQMNLDNICSNNINISKLIKDVENIATNSNI